MMEEVVRREAADEEDREAREGLLVVVVVVWKDIEEGNVLEIGEMGCPLGKELLMGDMGGRVII